LLLRRTRQAPTWRYRGPIAGNLYAARFPGWEPAAPLSVMIQAALEKDNQRFQDRHAGRDVEHEPLEIPLTRRVKRGATGSSGDGRQPGRANMRLVRRVLHQTGAQRDSTAGGQAGGTSKQDEKEAVG